MRWLCCCPGLVGLFVCLSVCPNTYLSACPPIDPSVCLSVCLSVSERHAAPSASLCRWGPSCAHPIPSSLGAGMALGFQWHELVAVVAFVKARVCGNTRASGCAHFARCWGFSGQKNIINLSPCLWVFPLTPHPVLLPACPDSWCHTAASGDRCGCTRLRANASSCCCHDPFSAQPWWLQAVPALF